MILEGLDCTLSCIAAMNMGGNQLVSDLGIIEMLLEGGRAFIVQAKEFDLVACTGQALLDERERALVFCARMVLHWFYQDVVGVRMVQDKDTGVA